MIALVLVAAIGFKWTFACTLIPGLIAAFLIVFLVKEKEHIFEFLQNAESIFVTEVQKVLTNLSQETAIKPAVVKCGHCEQDYQIPLMFDYSNFFVVGS